MQVDKNATTTDSLNFTADRATATETDPTTEVPTSTFLFEFTSEEGTTETTTSEIDPTTYGKTTDIPTSTVLFEFTSGKANVETTAYEFDPSTDGITTEAPTSTIVFDFTSEKAAIETTTSEIDPTTYVVTTEVPTTTYEEEFSTEQFSTEPDVDVSTDISTSESPTTTFEFEFTSDATTTVVQTTSEEERTSIGVPTTEEQTTLIQTTDKLTTEAEPTTVDPGEIFHHQLTLPSDALEGEIFEAWCSFKIVPEDIDFTVTWRLNASELRSGGRIGITTLAKNDSYHISTLTLDPVKAYDSGNLTCSVRIDHSGVESSVKASFTVLAIPTSHLSPITSTIISGEDAVNLTCTTERQWTGHPDQSEPPLIHWYINGTRYTPPVDDLIKFEWNATWTVSPLFTTEYACSASNQNVSQDEGPQSRASVYVIAPKDPVCPEETYEGIDWTTTAAGAVNVQECPDGMIGNATRRCSEDGDWEEPNFLNCVDETFVEIAVAVERLEEGVGGAEEAEAVSETLEEATNTTEPIPPGNINSAVDSVVTLAELRRQEGNAETVALSQSEMVSVTTTVSNLITVKNNDSWSKILREHPDKAVSLLETVDTYGGVFAIQKDPNENETISTEMLVTEVTTQSLDQTTSLTYPTVNQWRDEDMIHDTITISKETLDNIVNGAGFDELKLSVSSSYYKSIDVLLPANSSDLNETDLYIDSRVLSLSVNGTLGMTLNPPIEMAFSHNQIPENMTAQCAFWNYNESAWSIEGCNVTNSNDSLTQCECDHLTNFAILVSRKPPAEGTIHAVVLGIISIVGISISTTALLLTIIVYICLWKHVKSHQAVVLINLCIALLFANIVFVTGVDKTTNQDLCTAIAALLEFLYLAAFCVMLVEGIQLVISVMFVFHVRRKRETSAMLVLAWFVPATIVGICLGIGQLDGYGTEQYCWLDYDFWVFWVFIACILLIILINIGIVIAILKRISGSPIRQADKKRNNVKASLWNLLVIMPVLGVTWLFGIFSINSTRLVYQYLFCIFNSLQGLFIFLFHAVFNRKIMDYVKGKSKTGSKTSTRTVKSSSSESAKKVPVFDDKYTKNPDEQVAFPYDSIPAPDYDMDSPVIRRLIHSNEDVAMVHTSPNFKPHITLDNRSNYADDQASISVDYDGTKNEIDNLNQRKGNRYEQDSKADKYADRYKPSTSQRYDAMGMTNEGYFEDYLDDDEIAFTLSNLERNEAFRKPILIPRPTLRKTNSSTNV